MSERQNGSNPIMKVDLTRIFFGDGIPKDYLDFLRNKKTKLIGDYNVSPILYSNSCQVSIKKGSWGPEIASFQFEKSGKTEASFYLRDKEGKEHKFTIKENLEDRYDTSKGNIQKVRCAHEELDFPNFDVLSLAQQRLVGRLRAINEGRLQFDPLATMIELGRIGAREDAKTLNANEGLIGVFREGTGEISMGSVAQDYSIAAGQGAIIGV